MRADYGTIWPVTAVSKDDVSILCGEIDMNMTWWFVGSGVVFAFKMIVRLLDRSWYQDRLAAEEKCAPADNQLHILRRIK
jgi:hypothetical protein